MRPFTIRRCPGGAALLASAALIGWVVLLAPDLRRPRATDPSIASPQLTTIARRNDIGRHYALSPNPAFEQSSAADRRASDVIVDDYPLRESQLAALRLGDRIVLPYPDGGTIELRVARLETSNGRHHLTLWHDGLVSTFTMARGTFFGTLATAQGVYALEGGTHHSALIRHALLDQRINSHALDYRTAPAV